MRGRDIGCVVGLLVQCEMATAVIHNHASDELRKEWLEPSDLGREDRGARRIRAERRFRCCVTANDGHGRWRRLRHQRLEDLHLERGEGGFRDACRSYRRAAGRMALSLVVCPTDAKGLSGEAGGSRKWIFTRATPAELFFDDVPDSASELDRRGGARLPVHHGRVPGRATRALRDDERAL